ncbi:MAG: aspartate aminotransferase [Coxiella sp. RIFCSPHIGHO2_12_FULL_44_14]|nr:MAG: aspartate aminotransferase [Coxiella sp. RIFCSPHIGHO2_12_FULL_44_14]
MSHLLAVRAEQIESSSTMAMQARAKALRDQGHDVISLSVGEPDFDTPDEIKKAAIQAIQQGFTKYTAVEGIDPLKKAIIHKLNRDNQLNYQLNQIIVTSGVKEGFYNLAQAILNPDDEVVIPAPYWVSYPPIVELAGGIPVIVPSNIQQRFKITAAQLSAAITPKTRLFIINSPNNPSGMAYTRDELSSLAQVLLKHPHVLIATDDIYEYILWGQASFVNIVNACPELYSRTLVFNGVSKAYAMTGWRIGYAAGPTEIIQAMKKIQSQITTCANSIAQMAAVTALNTPPQQLHGMLSAFKERHRLVHDTLHPLPGVNCIESDGTFYSFLEVSKTMERLGMKSDEDLSTYLLNEAKVAVVPGTPFGCPGYIRLSFALDIHRLKEALHRLVPLFSS